MKKLLCAIFTILFINVFNFVPALADGKSYEINKVDINAVIMDNGDVNITEYLTYNFSGDFNGFIRDLDSNGADGCVINSVSIINEFGLEIIATNEDTGSENTYELLDNGDKTSIKAYSKSSNEEKTLKVNYTALNAAKKYETTGELYWNFYTVENVSSIGEVNLNISVNNQILTAENSRYEIFGDGELSTKYINDGINISYKNLSSIIGIDLIIPPEFLVNSLTIENSSNNNSEYIDYENNSGNNFDYESGAVIVIIILTIGVCILIAVLVVSKNNKYNEAVLKYRSGYEFISNAQYTDPPSEISPALVNLLVVNKNISSEILSSTLFYLCNLGYYTMEECEYTERGFFNDNIKSNLVFQRNVNKELPKENHLKFIIKWFAIYEIDNRFSLLEIQKDLKKSSEGTKFLKELNEWKDIVKSDAKEEGFFTNIENRDTLTNEFYNERLKWISYKEFIENTINLKERLNEINIADTMLIYARALEIDKNLIEPYITELINVAERDNNYEFDSLSSINRTYYFNYYLIHMNTMDSIYNNVMPNNDTSGIDTGGGFSGTSSGGDFGGGGGGGSDAF